jgi:hypothetical protein
MWYYAYRMDLKAQHHEESLFVYSHEHIRKQLGVHFFSILVAMGIFAFSMVVPWSYTDLEHESWKDTWPTAALWILAIAVEQLGSSIASVFMKLPFPAMYAGERMQAWIMLCFGESVIGLLIEPIFFDLKEFASLIAAFFMILSVCTAYFDIINADQFLHLFMVRKEKYKAFALMNFQLPFSLSIFLGGVGLKNILYVSNSVYELDTISHCSGFRRLSSTLMDNLSGGVAEEAEGGGVMAEEARRRLAGSGVSFTIEELDDLLINNFKLLTCSITCAMLSTIIIG